jgi:hypothetical protein
MADSPEVFNGGLSTFRPSTEEVSTLNGAATANPEHIQRMLFAIRNGDGSASDVPGRAYGPIRVSGEDRTLFYDPFDGGTIDTTTRWNAGTGTNAPTQTNSSLVFGVTTTASIYGKINSQPTFLPIIPGFLQASFAVNLGTAAGTERTAGHRFFGIGTSPATPATAGTVITDGVGFEIATDGKMYAVVYASGTRIFNTDLSSTGTGNATGKQPLDGGWHRYIAQIRTDKIYWYVDSLLWPVAEANFQVPSVQALPVLLQTTNPASGVAAGGYPLQVQGAVVADTAQNSTQLSDGTYPWRKANIDQLGRVATGSMSATSTVTNVAATTSNTTLKALNTNRRALFIYNGGTSNLTVKLGATVNILNSFTTIIPPSGFYELPDDPIYTGIVDGLWAATGGLGALVTELT